MLMLILLQPLIATASISVIDGTGTKITLQTPAKRIISLAPNLTEIVCELNGFDQLIARDSASDYPQKVKALPVVGNYYKLNIEKIVLLHPDLVLTEHAALQKKNIEMLNSFGIPVYVNHAQSIASVAKTFRDVGYLSDHPQEGLKKADLFLTKLTSCATKKTYQPSVFYEIWNAPLLTSNNTTPIGQIIVLCGGRNIAGNFTAQLAKISMETVLKANPDIIFTSVKDDNWFKFKALRAVKHKRVYRIPSELIDRTGPRMINGIEKICSLIQSSQPVP